MGSKYEFIPAERQAWVEDRVRSWTKSNSNISARLRREQDDVVLALLHAELYVSYLRELLKRVDGVANHFEGAVPTV